ncbi:MAG: malectin domain-containing carbohydrate-binding protein [Candidatus Latescibacterota bacterium]
MKPGWMGTVIIVFGVIFTTNFAGCNSGLYGMSIVLATDASPREKLAAKEINRYLYLRTGILPVIRTVSAESRKRNAAIIIARKDRALPATLGSAAFRKDIAALGPEEYLIRSVPGKTGNVIAVIGGDDAGILYGSYRFAELLGVRFYLHGDVIPDERMPLSLPAGLDERGKPLFAVRGIQPFHDFPEGPDWWDLDDYKAILSQLPKLGMNFFGLHTYPEGGPNAEPTVWIGLPEDIGEKGTVRFGYPSSYQNSLRGNWGYLPKKTGDYTRGADRLFDRDDYGAEVMSGFIPQPDSPEGSTEVFNRTGVLLREAFSHARSLGVKTCIGTETPLVIPKIVQERLKSRGKNPADSSVVAELYEGMFRRIMETYPTDYYWFWTPENWTWSGTSEELVSKTLTDLRAARAAREKTGASFQLATCGWVLGPERNRALFSEMLPRDWPLSCINRMVGMTPVDPAFTLAGEHPAWAIPWMEDDPALTVPQLWAGRMRCDAADALRYGCDGLFGIHWRTRALAPNVLALARAAWKQGDWAKQQISGPVDGRAFATDLQVEGTTDDLLYQTMRTDVSEYRFAVPNGNYTVRLRFCEPTLEKPGERAFGIALQGKKVLDRLDIFERAGKLRAHDEQFGNIRVSDGLLQVNFLQLKGAPCVSAIEIEGTDHTRRINCGGPAHLNFDADWTKIPARYAPTGDFYDDWCRSEFGPGAGPRASALFQRLDGYLPRPADWVNGPGGIRPDARPWEQVKPEYAFVDEFESLRTLVKGNGNLERFDYWLNTFKYLRAMGRLNCAWGEFQAELDKAKAEKDPGLRAERARRDALPKYRELPKYVDDVYAHLFPTVTTPGELGTVMNWEQHLFPLLFDKPREELGKVMRGEAEPPVMRKDYTGPARIIVPTVRTSLNRGENLNLKVIILDAKPPLTAELLWRPLGTGVFRKVPLTHVARGVYRVELPKPGEDFEYSIQVLTAGNKELVWPSAAPEMRQTVIVSEL